MMIGHKDKYLNHVLMADPYTPEQIEQMEIDKLIENMSDDIKNAKKSIKRLKKAIKKQRNAKQ